MDNVKTHQNKMSGKMTMAVLLVASLPILMGGAAIAPSLPLITEAFPDTPDAIISLIITLPSLAIALMGLPVGILADKYGKIKVFLISCILFTVAGTSGFYLDSIESILVGRFILGIGITGFSVCVTSLISDYYDGITRMKMISFQTAAMGIGVLILETAGGSLAAYGWREPFLIYSIGMIVFVLVAIFLVEPSPKTYENEESNSTDDSDKSLTSQILFCYVSIFLTMVFMFFLPMKLPYYVSELGGSALLAGVILGIHGFCEMLACLSFRKFSAILTRTRQVAIGFFLLGLGYCICIQPNLIWIIIGGMIAGVGIGMVTPTLINWLANILKSGSSGKVMGGYYMCLNLGQFVSTLIMVPLLIFAVSYGNFFFIAGILIIMTAVLLGIVGKIITVKKDVKSLEKV